MKERIDAAPKYKNVGIRKYEKAEKSINWEK